jgi:hypothetical protein
MDQHTQSIVDRRVKDIPKRQRKFYLKVVNGNASPRESIKANCFECMQWEGDDKGASLHDLVDRCTSTACLFYHHRPRLKDQAPAEQTAT